METSISYLTVLPSTVAEQDIFARNVIESVKAGDIDPLRLDIQLKSIENTIDMIRKSKSVKEAVIAEYSKYLGEGKTVEVFGAKITVSERKKYEYKDSIYSEMEKEIEQLKARMKARELILQTQEYCNVTGEKITPPKVTGSQVVTIKF